MRKVLVLAALGAALLLSGCQTQYGDMKYNEGVAAEAMGDRSFRITARGNAYTGDMQIMDYMLLKAAETTVAAGFTHFVITNGADLTQVNTGVVPGFIGNGYYVPASTYQTRLPGGMILIECGNPTGQISPQVKDAAEIIRSIGPRVYAAKKKATG